MFSYYIIAIELLIRCLTYSHWMLITFYFSATSKMSVGITLFASLWCWHYCYY